jgi:hypothetical protein
MITMLASAPRWLKEAGANKLGKEIMASLPQEQAQLSRLIVNGELVPNELLGGVGNQIVGPRRIADIPELEKAPFLQGITKDGM